ncbi:MAG TPA: hypothetical protein VHW60_23000, partial [Caulobacteraceae bacterium]|nr:hypothetical protein [Caulobacteraceae bacterium]
MVQPASGEGRSPNRIGPVAKAGRPGVEDLRTLLERDGVLILETDPFALSAAEQGVVANHWSDGRSKNSSFNPHTG